MYNMVKEMIDKMGYKVDDGNDCVSFDLRPSNAINIAMQCKVPIQVIKFLAQSDGMKVVESTKLALQSSSDVLTFKELIRVLKPRSLILYETCLLLLLRNAIELQLSGGIN